MGRRERIGTSAIAVFFVALLALAVRYQRLSLIEAGLMMALGIVAVVVMLRCYRKMWEEQD